MNDASVTPSSIRPASWLFATALLVSGTAITVAIWGTSIQRPSDLALLVVLSVFAAVSGDLWLPAFQIDVGLVLALAAIILTGPLGALIVLAIPELLRAIDDRHRVRRIATVSNLASFAWTVVAAQAILLAFPAAHTLVGRFAIYAPVATAMVFTNFLVTRGLVAGLVDRVFISGWRLELRALAACVALAPFAVVTASLLPVFGVLALVAAALGEAFLSLLVHLVTWTPRAGGLTVPEARARYAAALATRMSLSRSERRALLGAARTGTGRAAVRLSRRVDRDRVAKTLLLAGLWSRAEDCFSRLQPAEMGIESRVLLVAHGWAELTAAGTEQLDHGVALLTLHNDSRRYDRQIVAVARELITDSAPPTHSARVPYTRALPRRIAHLKLVA
ncbi:MAG: hypothetical protein M3065_17935 [Actinomycetota bacterium]|nr:hypothetical protein [Actinomycetota bacterium]